MKEISIYDLDFNPTSLNSKWWLVTSGNKESYNTMCASWGHIGSLWSSPDRSIRGGLPTAIVFVRPQRYTKKFMDENEYFSLTIFSDDYKDKLAYLGTHSGRDEDKIKKTELTVDFINDTPYFKEAEIVLIMKKIYQDDIREKGFKDMEILNITYPLKDFHTFYIGKIEKVLVKD